ncbi:unnamed protein product [Bursaphelenchus xylophilus]|uniref:(pine wood nematode) hypothetical protein n=1 Tax=Bursaphelenchus xylophilus TaxID=6326 RepID=A0A1I7SLM7_BURXY|nr:unnamed protein product [Bursaphelenchus xylophilus]CAG9129674.1 unnamed protein product [Bursaphelenchus xylophilus]
MASTMKDRRDSESSNSSSFENVSMAGCSDFDMDEASVSTRSDPEHQISNIRETDVMESSTVTATEPEASEIEANAVMETSTITAIEPSDDECLVEDLDNTRDGVPDIPTEPESEEDSEEAEGCKGGYSYSDLSSDENEKDLNDCADESGCCCEKIDYASDVLNEKVNEILANVIEGAGETVQKLERVNRDLQEKIETHDAILNIKEEKNNNEQLIKFMVVVGIVGVIAVLIPLYMAQNDRREAVVLKQQLVEVQETVKTLQKEVSQIHKDIQYSKYEETKRANMEMIQNVTRGLGLFAKKFAEKAMNITKKMSTYVQNNFDKIPQVEVVSVVRHEVQDEEPAKYPSFCFSNLFFQEKDKKTCILFKLFRL